MRYICTCSGMCAVALPEENVMCFPVFLPMIHVSVLATLILVPPLFALASLFEAGKSSFTPLQQSSFWTSNGGNYTFGFQAVDEYIGAGDHYLLSIWHSGDQTKTAIWWPAASNDVDYDPTVEVGASFHFSSTGSLQLHSSDGALLWSTNTTGSYAELQDTGNLVLSNNESSVTSWQSFNDSRDSLMLAGLDNITVINMPFLLQSRTNQSSYTIGRFHLHTDASLNLQLHSLDYMGHDIIYLYGTLTTQRGNFSITRDSWTYNNNTLIDQKRLTLNYDGNVRVYQWDSNLSSWRQLWQLVTLRCLLGAPCGPFGICLGVGTDGTANCSCPPGYKARDINDPYQGCESSVEFNASCSSSTTYTATMVEVPNTDYDYNDLSSTGFVTREQCKQMCLDRCADCIASVYLLDTSICYVKGAIGLGYLMNGYNKNATILFLKSNSVKVQVASETKRGRGWVIGVGAGVAALVLVVVGCTGLMVMRPHRRHNTVRGAIGDVGRVRFYRCDELRAATHNFSNKLGEGGFGAVYKGWVKVANRGSDQSNLEDKVGKDASEDDDNRLLAVAVKVLQEAGHRRKHATYSESYSQFRAEISTLGHIHHVSLVKLLGYSYNSKGSHGKPGRMLVYEYMEKGSLDKHLSLSLPWRVCHSIALGTARGIAYLHHECSPPIVHCNIKPHNILLDADFTPKVTDFGFARRFHSHRAQNFIVMSAIRSTHGYMAPEWFSSDELTCKVDVYSFGMVLLELVRGFRARSELDLPVVEWAIECIQEGSVISERTDGGVQEAATASANGAPSSDGIDNFQEVQHSEANEKLRLLKLAIWCIQHKPSMRLSMLRVVQLMEGTVTIEDPPIPPFPPHAPILRVP